MSHSNSFQTKTTVSSGSGGLDRPHRQHPTAMLTSVLKTIKELLIPAVVIFFVGQGGNSPLFTWQTIVLLLGVLFAAGFFNWLRFTWRVEEDELRIEQGILVRKKRYLPRDRIQAIDISSGPLHRWFGLVRVRVLTAGGSSPEAEISALKREYADRIIDALQVRQYNTRQDAKEDLREYRITRRRLLWAASTAASFGVALSVVGTLFTQIHQVVSEEQMIDWFEQYAGGRTTDFWFSVIFLGVVVAWLLSVFSTLMRFSGFALSRNGRELHIERGLFEKKQITLPLHRIQAVRVVEGILRQPFGYSMLYVEYAGFGDEGGKTTVLFPLIKTSELPAFMDHMLPEYPVVLPGVRPPGRAFFRYQIKILVPSLLAASVLATYAGFIWLVPVIFSTAALLGLMRYRDAAAGFSNEDGFFRFRGLSRSTVFFKRGRIQSLSVLANWFQRRKKLCSLMITVASGSGGVHFRVDHLEERAGCEWLDWYGDTKGLSEPAKNDGYIGITSRRSVP